jgi:hypothetical protein
VVEYHHEEVRQRLILLSVCSCPGRFFKSKTLEFQPKKEKDEELFTKISMASHFAAWSRMGTDGGSVWAGSSTEPHYTKS